MSSFSFNYTTYERIDAAPPEVQKLIAAAKTAAKDLAYAPYSHFHVGAAVLLENGDVILGSNQENASFPAGICAERVALAAVSSLHPKVKIKSISIAYSKEKIEATSFDQVLSPCGICRQVILEAAQHQASPIQIIMNGAGGKTVVVEDANYLLPFSFGKEML